MSSVAVSVPGKLILIGEHAAVYGRPALVAAVDLRLTATASELPAGSDPQVLLDLGIDADDRGLGTFTTSWPEIFDHTEQARAAWRRFSEQPSSKAFVDTGAGDPASLVKVALGESALDLELDGSGRSRSGLSLTVRSDIPMGSGFGSSAAASVAVVAAFLSLRGGLVSASGQIALRRPDRRRVRRLSLDVERRQHGLPSGVDNSTVLAGGILSAERSDKSTSTSTSRDQSQDQDQDQGLKLTPISARAPWLGDLRVVSTGRPAETTGAVVAAVRGRYERDRPRIGAAIDRIEEATTILKNEAESAQTSPEAVLHAIREAQAGLETLGVVPEPVRALVRRAEARGGAAKISGAGALSGSGAGTLLIYHPEARQIDDWDFLSHLPRHAIVLGAEGARFEDPSA